MTPEEVEALIFDHYQNESQTLTTGAEANLLKFKEMEGVQTEEEQARWDQIKKDFGKQKLLGGAGENDPVARVVAQMTQFNEGLENLLPVGRVLNSQEFSKPSQHAKRYFH